MQKPSPSHQAEEISFIGSQNCCVSFVDIIDSTKTTSNMSNPEKVRKYYEIFLNTIAAIARNFEAKIVKNVGDCLIFYYPETSDPTKESAFKRVFECCITMLEARATINEKLNQELLPPISYRISSDYGAVEIARSAGSKNEDLFGPTMNTCAKINSKASPNGIVIGEALSKLIQSPPLSSSLMENYRLLEIGVERQQIGFNNYRVYSLQRNEVCVTTVHQGQKEQKHFPCILLVDDEEDITYTFKEGLTSEGYDVEPFVDSMQALTHFSKLDPSHYDLAILDIRMPGLNGLQLYYRLKTINRNMKILFVSALDAVPELVSILPDVKTADDIIRKPVAVHDLVRAVKTALSQ